MPRIELGSYKIRRAGFLAIDTTSSPRTLSRNQTYGLLIRSQAIYSLIYKGIKCERSSTYCYVNVRTLVDNPGFEPGATCFTDTFPHLGGLLPLEHRVGIEPTFTDYKTVVIAAIRTVQAHPKTKVVYATSVLRCAIRTGIEPVQYPRQGYGLPLS